MGMPIPESVKEKIEVVLPPAPQMTEVNPNIVIDPKESGELTENEYDFILSSCLKPVHRKDPSVLAFIDSFIRCKSIAQASEECNIHRSLGYKYRNRKDISNVIQKLIDKSAVKYGFDNSEVMERVKEVVDFDPIEIMNPDGTYKTNLHDIAPEARRCLKKLKVKNLFTKEKDLNGIEQQIIIGEIVEYEFYDKLKASELVGKEKEMFKNTTKVEHTVTKDMASLLLASTKRANNFIENQNKLPDVVVVDNNE